MVPLLVAVAAGGWAVAHALVVVPRLPAPVADDLPGGTPPDYRSLVTPRNLILLTIVCLLSGQILQVVPTTFWPIWFIHISLGATLVGIDALTTYLPLRLTQLFAVELGLASLVVAWLQGWEFLPEALLGTAISGGMFWLVWRFSPAFGFGDVRLAGLVGFVAGSHSLNLLISALLFGTLIGALFAIVAWVSGHRSEQPTVFPYGPALWLGPFAAVLVSGLPG